jgi:hypothetical protein
MNRITAILVDAEGGPPVAKAVLENATGAKAVSEGLD